jgi:hypothetical protein
MSAIGGKADLVSIGNLCLLMTQSGHSRPETKCQIRCRFASDLELGIASPGTIPLFNPALWFTPLFFQLERIAVDLLAAQEDVPNVAAVGNVLSGIPPDD